MTQLCTFFLDDLFVGIDVREVQEVLRYQEMTSVPLGPPKVSGLINLRGEIVTAVDLRYCFGLESRKENELPMNVVIFGKNEAVSLLVDRIGDIFTIGDETFDVLPATLKGSIRKLTKGVYKLDGQLLLLLDTEQVLQETESAQKVVA